LNRSEIRTSGRVVPRPRHSITPEPNQSATPTNGVHGRSVSASRSARNGRRSQPRESGSQPAAAATIAARYRLPFRLALIRAGS
jgi:hypothetical protein